MNNVVNELRKNYIIVINNHENDVTDKIKFENKKINQPIKNIENNNRFINLCLLKGKF